MPHRDQRPTGFAQHRLDEGTWARTRHNGPGVAGLTNDAVAPLRKNATPSFNFPTRKIPSFDALWSAHPVIGGNGSTLDRGKYPLQCAINLFAAMLGAGFDMSTYSGRLSERKGGHRYGLSAEEFARWLDQRKCGIGGSVKLKDADPFAQIKNKTGIIYFANFYGRTGDHIDLFNGVRMTRRTSWLRIHLDITVLEEYFDWGDYREAEEIRFWLVP